ncbi:MAG: hypothetical protein ACREJO_15550 [Phycisphaerales bacterium]
MPTGDWFPGYHYPSTNPYYAPTGRPDMPFIIPIYNQPIGEEEPTIAFSIEVGTVSTGATTREYVVTCLGGTLNNSPFHITTMKDATDAFDTIMNAYGLDTDSYYTSGITAIRAWITGSWTTPEAFYGMHGS